MEFEIDEEHEIYSQLKLIIRNNKQIQNETLTAEYLINSNYSHNTSNIMVDVANWTAQYYTMFENSAVITKWRIVLFIAYFVIILLSLLGNSIVCQIVFCNFAMRSTTNIYLGSLSISDLLMTGLNIPLQLTQLFSRDWPFNNFLCKCMPFFQGLSVNVSSFTIACIALDRHQVIAHPLKPRPSRAVIMRNLALIWIVAALASAPYTVIANVEEEFTSRNLIRCRLIYPEPKIETRFILTLVVVTIQYVGPLSIAIFTYYKICLIIWNRQTIGIMSERERNQRYAAKWKTIKMLIVVLMVFLVCWFPFNTYHLYQDFRGIVGQRKHNSGIVLFCHLVAMSSICLNPFVYCWLNEKFQSKAKNITCCKWFNGTSWKFAKLSHLKTTRLSSKSPSLSTTAQSKCSYRFTIIPIHSLKNYGSEKNKEKKTTKTKVFQTNIENI